VDTRPSLLARLRDACDGESWQTFVDIYTPLIYRFCRQRNLQDADAADVTQEVLAQVARSMQVFEYQPERGRFRDWLGTVTRNKLRRFLEKRKRVPATAAWEAELDQVIASEQDAEWTAEFNAHLLQTACARVRPHFELPTWRAFEMVWLQRRTAIVAAQEMGWAIHAVYVAKSRVLKRLKEEVLNLAEDVPHQVPLA
jgi:RNA polymerase sigma factor (sigma-70 family)